MVGSFEAHEYMIFERKKVQDSIQALQVQTWKKHGGSNKFKSKGNKTQSKNSWVNTQNHKVMIGFLNQEEKEPHIRKRNKRRKMRSAITVKNGITWPRKTRERQKAMMMT